MRSDITLRQLRYFLAVADEGGFRAAAERLFVAQPALTRQIADLEVIVGTQLLHRSARGTSLTDAGQELHRRARSWLRSLHDVLNDTRDIGGGLRGHVRLVHSHYVPLMKRVLPGLQRFQAGHPGVTIEVERVDAELSVIDFIEHRQDLALTRLYPGRVYPSGLVARLCYVDRLCAVMQSSHPLAERPQLCLADLRQQPLVISQVLADEMRLQYPALVSLLDGGQQVANIAGRNFISACGLASCGIGIALAPQSWSAEFPSRFVKFAPIVDAGMEADIGLVHAADAGAAVLNLADHLSQESLPA